MENPKAIKHLATYPVEPQSCYSYSDAGLLSHNSTTLYIVTLLACNCMFHSEMWRENSQFAASMMIWKMAITFICMTVCTSRNRNSNSVTSFKTCCNTHKYHTITARTRECEESDIHVY